MEGVNRDRLGVTDSPSRHTSHIRHVPPYSAIDKSRLSNLLQLKYFPNVLVYIYLRPVLFLILHFR
jgi:hypothetical protein